jgi:hypothetical protein
MFKSNEQNATDVRILANFIKVRLIDEKADICTYAEMSAAIGGRNVQNGAYLTMMKARRAVEKDCRVLIDTVTNEGIVLHSDYAGAADKTMKHINRTAKKESRRIVNALPENLPNDQAIGIFSRISALGALAVCSTRSAIKKLEGKMEETGAKELPTAETLRLFEK